MTLPDQSTVTGLERRLDFQRMPLSELTNPKKPGPLMVYQDFWWATDDDDNVFFYKGKSYSPQCNINFLIAQRLLPPDLQTRTVFVPWAWVKFSLSDYV